MTRRPLVLALAAACALVPLGAGTLTPTAAAPRPAGAAAAADEQPRLSLDAPRRVVSHFHRPGGRASVDLGATLTAGSDPFELWATRASYSEGIRTVWRSPDGDVELPAGSMKTFNALHKFLQVEVTHLGTGDRTGRSRDVCLNSWGAARIRPDAPARSPYPQYCFANPYGLGTVQGIQAGWAVPLLGEESRGLRLPRGSYDVKLSIAPRFARALQVPAAHASRTVRVVVRRGGDDHHDHDHRGSADRPGTARPAAAAPTGPESADVEGPTPNLRSLPAWGIDVAPNGNFLRFNATVWNGGDSPLVVDGFRVRGTERMDAYQYFFDTDGNQTGYRRVGSFEYDDKASHQHWHFRDFATYTLLRADQTTAVKSRKEAFCLANTDSIDLTGPGADWNPENTDLSTDCGSSGSMSLRQVLAAGWGDTYSQFRAGQSFDLRDLPNGRYYIAVIANPRHRLVETSIEDNVALRRVHISGKPGARKVRVPQVGIIEEPDTYW